MPKCDICGTSENLSGLMPSGDGTYLDYRCGQCEYLCNIKDSYVLTAALEKKEITHSKYCEIRDKMVSKESTYWRKKHAKWDREFENKRKSKLKRLLNYFKSD